GAAFIGGSFERYCKAFGITQLPTTPYNPRADGSAEKAVGMVKEALRLQMLQAKADGKTAVAWPSLLDAAVASINYRPMADSPLSRAAAFFARSVRHPTSLHLPEGI